MIEFFCSALNVLLLTFYAYLAYSLFRDYDFVNALRDMIVSYMVVGSQYYIFFVTTVVESTLMILRFYFMWYNISFVLDRKLF
jgi:hypothetical protein